MKVIVKGIAGIKEATKKSATQLKLKSGESAVIRILTPADEIISVYEHVEQINGNWQTITCLGRNECPLCQAGKRPQFKSYLVVAHRDDENKVKIFKASKKVAVQLLGLVEEYGDITKRDFKIFRQGDKLDTTYQFFPRDPEKDDLSKYELPDVEALVQPLTREAILAIMNNESFDVGDEEGQKDEGFKDNQDDFPF